MIRLQRAPRRVTVRTHLALAGARGLPAGGLPGQAAGMLLHRRRARLRCKRPEDALLAQRLFVLGNEARHELLHLRVLDGRAVGPLHLGVVLSETERVRE